MFKHFLITRFNLRKEDWISNKHNKPILTDEWHVNRFELFKTYCFPSVAAQTNKNFDWIVYFDTTTKDEFRTIISELEKELPNFKPFYIDGMTHFIPSIRAHMKNVEEDFIITTGIDNDDCISMNFIDEIQQQFDAQEFMCIDFVDGYTVETQSSIKIGKKLHAFNPFLSLIERNIDPKTIKDRSHRNWKKERNIKRIPNKRIWSSIIHFENKVNEFTGYGKVDPEEFFEKFKILPRQESYIRANLVPTSKWKMQSFINHLDSRLTYASKSIKRSLGLYYK
ncbi:glycosyltransferase [Winogradskyella aurantiaca]|uniref:glycosyltransferase n=1 Tax=Winogradskyella aurantiaca TaxID=2219558 RepID=UPI000E1D7242|nr:glycosyltransferase [Winogradskyella aurantiaca]